MIPGSTVLPAREFSIMTTHQKLKSTLGEPVQEKLDNKYLRISFGDDTLRVWADVLSEDSIPFAASWSAAGNREYAEILFPKRIFG